MQVQVQITVQDFGLGISDEDKKNLFQPYFKTSDKASRLANSKSHGLGLSICQKIANGLGGKILVKSEIDIGSSFTFEFVAKKVMNVPTMTISQNEV